MNSGQDGNADIEEAKRAKERFAARRLCVAMRCRRMCARKQPKRSRHGRFRCRLRPASLVSGFMPLKSEINPLPLMQKLAAGARLALPRIAGRG